MSGHDNEKLEKQINLIYRQFGWLAERFHFVFNRPVVSVGGRPNVVFLGNHSAGKSTFINYLLGGDVAVQDTGVAPTDDGFTVIVYGEKDTEYLGPAALPHLSDDFKGLERLGPSFLKRLRVKVRNRELLQGVNLIDSPGMIDSAQAEAQRDYDFMAAVKSIAEISDLVLFLFDPDKPGTTGEAMTTVRQCLTGMEFKLRILMNKADTFDSMYDFARAYGALCWNLARVLRSKDLPPVYTTYVPVPGTESSSLELQDFDRYRSDVADQVRAAPQRRADNMIASLRDDMAKLSMHVRILSAARRRIFATMFGYVVRGVLGSLLAAAAAATLTFMLTGGAWLLTSMGAGVSGMLVAALATVAAKRRYAGQKGRLFSELDPLFDAQYIDAITGGRCDDLLGYWRDVREVLPDILRRRANELPLSAAGPLRKLDKVMAKQISQMKANVV